MQDPFSVALPCFLLCIRLVQVRFQPTALPTESLKGKTLLQNQLGSPGYSRSTHTCCCRVFPALYSGIHPHSGIFPSPDRNTGSEDSRTRYPGHTSTLCTYTGSPRSADRQIIDLISFPVEWGFIGFRFCKWFRIVQCFDGPEVVFGSGEAFFSSCKQKRSRGPHGIRGRWIRRIRRNGNSTGQRPPHRRDLSGGCRLDERQAQDETEEQACESYGNCMFHMNPSLNTIADINANLHGTSAVYIILHRIILVKSLAYM